MTTASNGCSICGKHPVKARGWCNSHWLRWYRHGSPYGGVTVNPNPPECISPCCHVPDVNARGLCNAHYMRWLRNGDAQLDKPIRNYRNER